MRKSILIALALIAASCRAPARTSTTDFDTMSRDLIYGVLALSPVYATSTGYHRHNGISLDEQLDDYSPAGTEAQRRFYQSFQGRIASVDSASLDNERRADLEIVKGNVALSLLELGTLQSYKHNPTTYVELTGTALFSPYVLNYAPKEQRLGHIIKRLEKHPALFEQAKANLIDPPAVWKRVARSEMETLAAPVSVKQALAEIASHHATPETYLPEARKALDEATSFVREKELVTLPARANLQIIETPEFMRGIYAVGGFNAAPALEPQLGAFFWITPIPKTWPKERIESKLREYNFYNLKLLTIHEAMPGHYVQFEIANDLQPKSRRLLRSVYGNNPYVEGWAQYATQVMLDNGFLDNSPELRLTFLKQELRVLANTIIDVRLHTLNMSDQDALELMQKQTFQETEEATAKLQRAKLSSCQLPTYLAGWRGWFR